MFSYKLIILQYVDTGKISQRKVLRTELQPQVQVMVLMLELSWEISQLLDFLMKNKYIDH